LRGGKKSFHEQYVGFINDGEWDFNIEKAGIYAKSII
jgi:hypothetical protein